MRIASNFTPPPEFTVPFVWEAPATSEPSVAEPAREAPSEPTAPAPTEAAPPAPAPEATPPLTPTPVAPSVPLEAAPEIPSVLPEPTPAPSAPATATPPEQRTGTPPVARAPVPAPRTAPAPRQQRKEAPVAHAPTRNPDRPSAEPGQAAIAPPPPRTVPVVVAAHPVAGMSTNRPPAYPPLAQRRGEEGSAVVRVDVSADGQARSVLVLQSSGHALLDEAAAAAVRLWRFVPATRDNVPIAATADVPVDFKLPH